MSIRIRRYLASLILFVGLPIIALAQNGTSNEVLDSFNVIEVSINQRTADITVLQSSVLDSDGILLEVLNSRIEDNWIRLLELGNDYASSALALPTDEGQSIELRERAVSILASHPGIMSLVLNELSTRVLFPDSNLAPADQAAIYFKLFDIQDRIDNVLGLMIVSYSLQAQLGVDTTGSETDFATLLRERAINTSVYLDISVAEADAIGAGLVALPGDVDLIAKLSIANDRIVKGTAVLDLAVRRLEARGVDVTDFRQQLITTTGKITTDLLNVGVLKGLISNWGGAISTAVTTKGPTFIFQLIVFLLIVFGFRKLSKLVEKLTDHALKRSNVGLSRLLHSMIVASSANLVLMLGILIALSQLGISLGPLLTGLGIAGFVIGFALQDTLSNFASGLMILFYKPFDVGDLVDFSGVFGTVDHMSLVNTTILTLDNQRITLPNSMIWGGVIKNVTAQKLRRVDLTFGISYDDSIEKTEEILNKLVDDHDLILTDPEPIVRLHELGDSSLNFVVRAWTNTSDYWDVYWDLIRSVKLSFDKEGISIPYPQSDVHLIKKGED